MNSQRHQQTLRNAAWVLFHRGVSGCSVLVAHVLFARALQPAEVGLYHLAVFVGVLAATLASAGLASAATRFIAAEAGGGGGAAPAIARRVLVAAAAGVVLVAAAMTAAVSCGPPEWRPASLGAMVGFLAAHALRLVCGGVAGGYADFKAQARASVAAALIMPAGAAWLLLHGGDASSALWITAAQAAVTGGLVLVQLRDRLRGGGSLPPAIPGLLRRYCAAVMTLQLLDAVVWQQSESVFLRALSAPAQLGFYTVAFTLVAQAMQLVPGSLAVAVFPALAFEAGTGNVGGLAAIVRRTTRLLALGAVPIATFGTVFAPELIGVLYGREFVGGAMALRILWIGAASGTIAAAAAASLYTLGRVRLLIAIGVPVAAVNIALDLALIPDLGAAGAAVANTITQLLGAGAAVYAAHRVLGGGTVPWRRLLRIVASTALAAIAAHWAAAGAAGVNALVLGGVTFLAIQLAGLLALRELRSEDLDGLGGGTGSAGPGAGARR